MGLFAKSSRRLFGGRRTDDVTVDAERLYQALMAQSRQTAFYGPSRFPDNYDGRIDVLTLHMAGVLTALTEHGVQGSRLSQALFDVMKDDFEVALREEGLSDAGVKRRIKPMVSYFYERLRQYAKALQGPTPRPALVPILEMSVETKESASCFANYLADFAHVLARLSLGETAQVAFDFPKLTPLRVIWPSGHKFC